ncbi:unnamed protein product [Albugo candida]|uniref:Uncharacterized protein n=1 Tax=Albugo candida TaxID=65357 RepID=A0A024FX28_9STRA|nr:unnamed protein product [Albugo candida]|eukprot:CCI11675.1 unnamed protein product [Albugo candida]
MTSCPSLSVHTQKQSHFIHQRSDRAEEESVACKCPPGCSRVDTHPSSELQSVLLARLNTQREEYLRQAEELVHFAQLNDSIIRLGSKPTAASVKSNNLG